MREKFDAIRMVGGDNIVQIYTRIKEVVNTIIGLNGNIEDWILK